jgi:hypothetical protein
MSRFFAQCTVAEQYSIRNREPATSQNLKAVCRLAFLLLSIDRIVEPSRKEEASSTELQRAWSRFFQRIGRRLLLFQHDNITKPVSSRVHRDIDDTKRLQHAPAECVGREDGSVKLALFGKRTKITSASQGR